MNIDIKGRIEMVKGEQRGIGYLIQIEMEKRGENVIEVERKVGGMEEMEEEIRKIGRREKMVKIDIKDMEEIERIGGKINERWGKIDIMVENEGILGKIQKIGNVEEKKLEKVMNINVKRVWRMISQVDKMMREQDEGREIMI